MACGVPVPSELGAICADCHAEATGLLTAAYCPRCGRTLSASAIHEDGCARCRTERHWNVRAVARVGLYNDTLSRLLVGLKYAGQLRSAPYLGGLLADAIRATPWGATIDALVPVPMHWLRRLERSCDHAAVLAQATARRLGLPVLEEVARVRGGPSQLAQPSATQRLENVKGAFGPRRRWVARWLARAARSRVVGRTVCIIDNLLYTGATVCEVSKVLRRLGANRIYAAVVSRPDAPADPPIRHLGS